MATFFRLLLGYMWCPFRKPYPGRIRRSNRIGACSRAMVAILRLLIGALRNCIMSRGRLEAEVIVLRHQLNILRRQSTKRVRPNAFDRAIFVCLYRHFPDIGNAVRPETVIRWHRMGFRAWWRWKSRNPGGRPKIDPELREPVCVCHTRRWAKKHLMDRRHHEPDSTMVGPPDHRSLSMGHGPGLSRPRQRLRLWRGVHAAGSVDGHSRSPYRASIAMAERICRARNRLDPT
jgi:hypothetical protein